MPYRKISLVNGEIYHVFNRAVERQPIFLNSSGYNRALKAADFYRHSQSKIRLSYYLSQSQQTKEQTRLLLESSPQLVDIVTYCFMPNHYHFLLCQQQESGISTFIGKFQNSYVRYFNDHLGRKGPLFEGAFKVVRVESERQLLQVSRYIHLNPYSAGIIKSRTEVCNYKWSSMSSIINQQNTSLVKAGVLLGGLDDPQKYRDFVLDNADYQKTLHNNKHLFIDS